METRKRHQQDQTGFDATPVSTRRSSSEVDKQLFLNTDMGDVASVLKSFPLVKGFGTRRLVPVHFRFSFRNPRKNHLAIANFRRMSDEEQQNRVKEFQAFKGGARKRFAKTKVYLETQRLKLLAGEIAWETFAPDPTDELPAELRSAKRMRTTTAPEASNVNQESLWIEGWHKLQQEREETAAALVRELGYDGKESSSSQSADNSEAESVPGEVDEKSSSRKFHQKERTGVSLAPDSSLHFSEVDKQIFLTTDMGNVASVLKSFPLVKGYGTKKLVPVHLRFSFRNPRKNHLAIMNFRRMSDEEQEKHMDEFQALSGGARKRFAKTKVYLETQRLKLLAGQISWEAFAPDPVDELPVGLRGAKWMRTTAAPEASNVNKNSLWIEGWHKIQQEREEAAAALVSEMGHDGGEATPSFDSSERSLHGKNADGSGAEDAGPLGSPTKKVDDSLTSTVELLEGVAQLADESAASRKHRPIGVHGSETSHQSDAVANTAFEAALRKVATFADTKHVPNLTETDARRVTLLVDINEVNDTKSRGESMTASESRRKKTLVTVIGHRKTDDISFAINELQNAFKHKKTKKSYKKVELLPDPVDGLSLTTAKKFIQTRAESRAQATSSHRSTHGVI